MSKLIRRVFLVVFVGMLIVCGFTLHTLDQSLTELDTALDQLELSLTELKQVMGIEPEGEEE